MTPCTGFHLIPSHEQANTITCEGFKDAAAMKPSQTNILMAKTAF